MSLPMSAIPSSQHNWRFAFIATAIATLVAIVLIGHGTAPTAFKPPIAMQVFGGPSSNETYLWKPVAIGGGGFITGMSQDRQGKTTVIRADVYGSYIWNQEADRWVQLVNSASMPERFRTQNGMNAGVYEIVVAPSDPDRLYMAVKGFVFRSDDRGTEWQLASGNAGFPMKFDANGQFRHYGPFLAVSPDDENFVFFGTPNDGLWRSTDGGKAWQRVSSVPPAKDLRPDPGIQTPGIAVWFEPGVSGRIWAMSPGNGMFVSADKGLTFSPLAQLGAEQPRMVRQGAFTADGSFLAADPETQTIWRFRNNAWTDLKAHSNLKPQKYAAIAVNPTNQQILAFTDGGAAVTSSDTGDHWRTLSHRMRVGRNEPPWLHVADRSYFAIGRIYFDRADENRLWAVAGTGPYFANVGLGTMAIEWESHVRGIEELVANDVIQPPGGYPLFAAWDFGIHEKRNLDAFSRTYGPKERVLIAAQQLAYSPSNPSFIVTNASDTNQHCCWQDGDSVLAGYSLDGGRRWEKFPTLPHPPGTKEDDPWRMSFGMIAVASDNIDNIVWAPSFNRAPFYTLDRGQTWNRVVFPGEVLPYTGSHRAFYLQRKTLVADPVEPATFYLVHSGDGENAALKGLWRTQDGGKNWQKIFNGEISPVSQFAAKLRAAPGKSGQLFFTSGIPAADVDTRLRRSRDGGKTWEVVDGVDLVDDIAFGKAADGASDPTIYLSGRVDGKYGIWRSTDNGKNWSKIADFPLGTLDQVTVMGADPDVFGRVYIGYQGSGWIYGAPADCRPEKLEPSSARQCNAVAR